MTLFYKRFMRLIGLLPFENQDFSYLGCRIHLACCLVWSFIFWTMTVFYVINARKIPSIDIICETVVTVGVAIRYYLLLLHRLELTNLLNESQAIWKEFDEDGQRTVRNFEPKIRLLFKILFGSCVIINVMYSVSAIVSTLNPTIINDTYTQLLPYKWYSDDGPNHWPGYKIIFVIQVLVINNACMVAASVDTAGPLLIIIGAGYFRALRHQLLRIQYYDDEVNIDLELITCLRLHQRILNFCSRIEKITRTLFFVQVLASAYNLSLAGLQLAGTNPERYKFLPVALFQLGGLFICQWSPDYLVDESTAISTAAYFVSVTWMRCRRLRKLLILIIVRSQRPVQMTAAGIVNLSLENFRSMLTSALSFFTVLRNFNF